MDKVIYLTCCCCGDETKGRQWHNRDTGFGLCDKCADWISRRESETHMRSNYGVKGTHYKLTNEENKMSAIELLNLQIAKANLMINRLGLCAEEVRDFFEADTVVMVPNELYVSFYCDVDSDSCEALSLVLMTDSNENMYNPERHKRLSVGWLLKTLPSSLKTKEVAEKIRLGTLELSKSLDRFNREQADIEETFLKELNKSANPNE